MKLKKQAIALFLCFLMVVSSLGSALAQTNDFGNDSSIVVIDEESSDVVVVEGCSECGVAEGHAETCSQHEAPVPEGCVECGQLEGHAEGCSLNVNEEEEQSQEISEDSETLNNSTESVPEVKIPTVAEQLMVAESVEAMYLQVLDLMQNDPASLNALTTDEIAALRVRIAKLDPESDDVDTQDLLDTLGVLPNGGEELMGDPEELDFDNGYIYFDLAQGDVKITQDKYIGYFNGEEKTGEHKSENKYYIFQGDGETNYTKLPTYGDVTYNGQDWGDYITNHPVKDNDPLHNNDNVDTVIAAWNSAAENNGRTATEHKISIESKASNQNFDVTIDSIWSSFQGSVLTNGDNHPESKYDAGLSFVIDCRGTGTNYINNILKLHVKGDNRFSRIHCATHDRNENGLSGNNGQYNADKDHTNSMYFDGDENATLTLANMTIDRSGTSGMYTASLIGGTDNWDHSAKMFFDEITVYAGSGQYDFCTAIGGGGNGSGRITINGGRITAIHSSTGTAIGGGCGTSGIGGYGEVIINGGEVYAYSYKPQYSTPGSPTYQDAQPTAIGGGSSGIQIGGTGIVNITGGYVYAYSEVGNAIGGGGGGNGSSDGQSFASTLGGVANVEISGGIVKAISGLGCAIGGGPGGGNRYADYAKKNNGQLPDDTVTDTSQGFKGKTVVADGGSARLVISGEDTQVFTGSIGGGSPLNDNREWFSVGAAIVEISGGTVYGQVVMNGKVIRNGGINELPVNSESSFTMTGGTIDNSNPDDGNSYLFVEENGGAVYVHSGTATMSGGTIQNASAPLGGAIYVNGGDFTLSGTGLITNCHAVAKNGDSNSDLGGAVYVEGGNVKITGGEISNCYANHGGAVYVTGDSTVGGNFSMAGGTIDGGSIEQNATYGGAVYVNGGKFTMESGTLTCNSVPNDGGAVYIKGGTAIIGKEGCNNGSHGHPILSENTAQYGGAIAVSGSNPIIHCCQMTGNTASENGGAAYVTGGSLTMYNGAIGDIGVSKANTAKNGGALYVAGGNFDMYGGTLSNNTALNGGGVYVDGGNFTMTSGTMSHNTAVERTTGAAEAGTEGYGGGAYAASGNIYIGIMGCAGTGTTHTEGTDEQKNLAHPVVNANMAEFGGALAVNGGTVYVYCGEMLNNESDNDGTGMNVFMKGDNSELWHYLNSADIGESTNHGMVTVGGKLTIVHGSANQFVITITYFSNPTDGEGVDVKWTGKAPDGYYLNLPYCPEEWQQTEDANGYTFVGWAKEALGTQPSEIREKPDYYSIGTPMKMEDLIKNPDTEGGDIHFYAVWAPKVNDISYAYTIDGVNIVHNMDGITHNNLPTQYNFEMTSDSIIFNEVAKGGYTFKGWVMYADHDKIANWGADPDVTPYDKAPTKMSELSGFTKLMDNKLATLQNFGDITLVAIFEPAYTDLIIDKGVSDTNKDPNAAYIYTIEGKPYDQDLLEFEIEAVVLGNGSITIQDLPVGDYTITEQTQWSWRYDVSQIDVTNADGTIDESNKSKVSFSLSDPETTVTAKYTNTRNADRIYWLTGDSYCQNWFDIVGQKIVQTLLPSKN